MRLTKTMKQVVMMVGGNPVGRFDCINDVARMLNITATAITSRILREAVIDNVRFRFREGAADDELPNMSPEKPSQPKPSKIKLKKITYKSDDDDLSDTKYTIVPYEVKNGRICITRCTTLDAPQPFVGSGRCAKCPHFQGRNKKTHEVACSNILRRSLR